MRARPFTPRCACEKFKDVHPLAPALYAASVGAALFAADFRLP